MQSNTFAPSPKGAIQVAQCTNRCSLAGKHGNFELILCMPSQMSDLARLELGHRGGRPSELCLLKGDI